MIEKRKQKSRPYWHVDAKWLTGILLLFILNITIFVFILVRLTSPEPGIDLLTVTLASTFSFEGGGLDEAGDIEVVRQKIAESPNGEWQPIPGMLIFIREEDIAGKTPREARLWFFRQWAEPLYYDGEQGLANLITDPQMKEGLEDGVGPLGFISAETHSKLQQVFIAFGTVSLILFGLLIFFSYRFGRLGSPGCIFFLVAVPGFVVIKRVDGWLLQANQSPIVTGEETVMTRYTQLALDVLPGVVQPAVQIYTILMFLGLGLMLVAFIGNIFIREKNIERQDT